MNPLHPKNTQRRSGLGIRTDADNAALFRWQLEHFYKQTISADLLAFDRDGKGRDETRLFMDVLRTNEDDLRALDAEQIADHTPDQMRGNYARPPADHAAVHLSRLGKPGRLHAGGRENTIRVG